MLILPMMPKAGGTHWGNSGKLEHQREHFAMLSKDINDLIKTFGTTQKLYQDHCSMYDEGKSGYWISENKEIRNLYYGAQMLTCGSVNILPESKGIN
ncbi:DUF3347 domain-containing protein [Flavobacterium sp. RSP49]|uniref:DUF3347 domain-containing protein n=1 Tax=Flavobacterium sp. RSP49 TaxID=2497487 RepID=UPI001F28CB30|nr:DUF3347 domain-containing protein [Flavobacterium sp. RSP49]